tara:strand:+ start:9303 stop:11267 length:1965 start_codon:yes stop_codon:yes gene_type:complete
MAENEKEKNIITGEKEKDLLDMFKSNLDIMTTPKVDTTAVDEQIKKLSTPKGSSVDEKLAALYRRQGSGRVLETQKNIALAVGPVFELYKTRKAASDAEFQERTKNMPDYDDTNIFGEANGTQIPLSDNIKNISDLLKKDYRLISNLNINDPRYEEARKRIEENEKLIVNYDAVNKKLFDIRNGRDRDTGEVIQQISLEEFSDGMPTHEAQMWKDIYAGDGSNIKNIDGNLFWVDPTNSKNKIDLRYIGNSPTQINGVSVNAYVKHKGIEAEYINNGGLLDDYSYTAIIEGSLNNLRRLKPDEIKSLIFDGINVEVDDIYGGPDTKEFIYKVIKDTFGDLSDAEILNKIEEMKSISVIDSTKYKDENGNAASLKKLFLKYETNKTRNAIQEAENKRIEEENKKKVPGPDKKTSEQITQEKFNTKKVTVDNPNDKDSGFKIEDISENVQEGVDLINEIVFSDNELIRLNVFGEGGGVGAGQQSIRPSDLFLAISRVIDPAKDTIAENDLKKLIAMLKQDGYTSETAKQTGEKIINQINKVFKELDYETKFRISTVTSFKTQDAKRLARYLEKLQNKLSYQTYSPQKIKESDGSGSTAQDFIVLTGGTPESGLYYKLKSGKIGEFDGSNYVQSGYKINKDGMAVVDPTQENIGQPF